MADKDDDAKQMRAIIKARQFAKNYGMGSNKFISKVMDTRAHRAMGIVPKEYEHTLVIVDEWTKIGAQSWAALEGHMKQTWLIDGEWSQYHHAMASKHGWTLSQVQGMWQIVRVETCVTCIQGHMEFGTDPELFNAAWVFLCKLQLEDRIVYRRPGSNTPTT